jgi:hypothetical protein
MNAAKYILKKAKIIARSRKINNKIDTSALSKIKLKSSSPENKLKNTYSLLSNMYSKENEPLFI